MIRFCDTNLACAPQTDEMSPQGMQIHRQKKTGQVRLFLCLSCKLKRSMKNWPYLSCHWCDLPSAAIWLIMDKFFHYKHW